MDLGLGGRVVLVVGGSGFVGSAVVARLREEGATAVVGSRTTEDGVVLDAGDASSVRRAVAEVLDRHGRLDGVVITAAPPARGLDTSMEIAAEDVLTAIDDKALAFLRVAQAALPAMRAAGHGRIVGVSGQNAFLSGNLAGSVRNATMNVMAKNLADSVAGTGITVNIVNPGAVAERPRAEVERGVPGQSSPDQIADLVAFLVSGRSAAISGESIAIGHRLPGITGL